MAHQIQALIGRPEVLEVLRERFDAARRAPLAQGYEMVPATSALLEAIDAGCPPAARAADVAGFVHLGGGLVPLLLELSGLAPVAYIETEYFGGVGTQAAAAYANGEPAYIQGELEIGPLEVGPINEALKILGVLRGHSIDEFEAVGLGRYRSMDDWE